MSEENKTVEAEFQTNTLCDIMEIIVTSIVTVLLIFAFIGRVAIVDGSSMTNTLEHLDKLIVSDTFYSPKQGDIIVCQTDFFGFDEPIVKRVIAVEGQKIRIDTENWKVYVDGEELNEDYIRTDGQNETETMTGLQYSTALLDENGEYTVPQGSVFVMGDNRTIGGSWDSRDSRVGPVDVRYIAGKVIFRIMPKLKLF